MIAAPPALELAGATVAYDGVAVLRGVSLALASGEMLAVVGPNGAGKTTLLRAMAGLVPLQAGRASVAGSALDGLAARDRGRRIAFVEAESFEPDELTVREVVGAGRFPHRPWWRWGMTAEDERAVDDALASAALRALAERRYGTLSSGERQRVWIALAVAQRSDVILLDEPTSHLDVRHAFDVLTLVRTFVAQGRAVAAVLHDLNLAAAFADTIALVAGGVLLACGPPHDVLDPVLLERAYGVAFDVLERDGRIVAFAKPQDGSAR